MSAATTAPCLDCDGTGKVPHRDDIEIWRAEMIPCPTCTPDDPEALDPDLQSLQNTLNEIATERRAARAGGMPVVPTQAERDRDELAGALRALVDALPRCRACDALATHRNASDGRGYCDAHGDLPADVIPHGYAPALRAALALLARLP